MKEFIIKGKVREVGYWLELKTKKSNFYAQIGSYGYASLLNTKKLRKLGLKEKDDVEIVVRRKNGLHR